VGAILLCKQSLIDVDLTCLEPVSRSSHEQPPSAVSSFIGRSQNFSAARLETTYPMAQCEGIVFA